MAAQVTAGRTLGMLPSRKLSSSISSHTGLQLLGMAEVTDDAAARAAACRTVLAATKTLGAPRTPAGLDTCGARHEAGGVPSALTR